jgi:arylformamidase
MDAVPLDRLMGSGVVLRLDLPPCAEITAEHLSGASPEIEPGDIVVLCTDWASKWGTPDWTRHPYLSLEGVDWLISRGVKLVAMDTINPDLPFDLRPEGFNFPVHRELLSRGILIAEQLANVNRLSGQRAEFIFGALSIADCDGAPTRVIARPTM